MPTTDPLLATTPTDARATAPSSRPRFGRARALPQSERRAAIVAAATPLFRAHGRAVTTRQIANAAGIAEGTIFRAFRSKEQLIDAVIDNVFDLTDVIGRIRGVGTTTPLETRVIDCARIVREHLDLVVGLMVVLHSPGGPQQRHAHPRKRGLLTQAHSELLDAIAGVLEPDAAALTCTPRRAAELLHSLTFSSAHPMVADTDRFDADDIARILLHGILT